jgi:hypothetical protein
MYSSQNVIRVGKSMKVRWVWRVACMGKMRNAHNVSIEETDGKNPLTNEIIMCLELLCYVPFSPVQCVCNFSRSRFSSSMCL